jgi:hypothetical protein
MDIEEKEESPDGWPQAGRDQEPVKQMSMDDRKSELSYWNLS